MNFTIPQNQHQHQGVGGGGWSPFGGGFPAQQAPQYSFNQMQGISSAGNAVSTCTQGVTATLNQISNTGNYLNSYGKHIAKLEAQANYVDATSMYHQKMTEINTAFGEKTNWLEMEGEYKEAVAKAHEGIGLENLSSSQQARFNKYAEYLASNGGAAVAKRARDGYIDEARAELDTALLETAQKVSLSGVNSTPAAIANSEFIQKLDVAQEAGLVTAQQANSMLRKFHSEVDTATAKRHLREDPDSLITALNDPKQYRGLDPAKREAFIDQAMVQWEQRENNKRQQETYAYTSQKRQMDTFGQEIITRASLGEIDMAGIKEQLRLRKITPEDAKTANAAILEADTAVRQSSPDELYQMHYAVKQGVATVQDIRDNAHLTYKDKTALIDQLYKERDETEKQRDQQNIKRLTAYINPLGPQNAPMEKVAAAAIYDYTDRVNAGQNPALAMNEVATKWGAQATASAPWGVQDRYLGLWSLTPDRFDEFIDSELTSGALAPAEAQKFYDQYEANMIRKQQKFHELFPKPTASQLK